jgi:hypothetical protein
VVPSSLPCLLRGDTLSFPAAEWIGFPFFSVNDLSTAQVRQYVILSDSVG